MFIGLASYFTSSRLHQNVASSRQHGGPAARHRRHTVHPRQGTVEILSSELEINGHKVPYLDQLFWAGLPILSYLPSTVAPIGPGAASGLPIVTTDMPGCRDIVRDGVNGYLVPPGDAAALAERIGALAADGKLRARMGKAGRSLAESEFSQDRVLERTLAVYREVTG